MKPPPIESQVSSASAAPPASFAMSRSVLGWRGAGVSVSNAMAVAGSKAMRRLSGELETLGGAHFGDQRLGGVRIDALRRLTAKPEDHGLVGRMAAPREGERAEQRDLDRRDPVDGVIGDKPIRERGGGFHRPDRVRRRGADADLEELEDADHRLGLGHGGCRAALVAPFHDIRGRRRASGSPVFDASFARQDPGAQANEAHEVEVGVGSFAATVGHSLCLRFTPPAQSCRQIAATPERGNRAFALRSAPLSPKPSGWRVRRRQSNSSRAPNFVTYADDPGGYLNREVPDLGTETTRSERKRSCSSSRSLRPSFLGSSLEVGWRSL